MNTPSEAPSRMTILVCLLRFFASPAEEQAAQLSGYDVHARAKGGGPHVDSPLVELAEALCKYGDVASWAPHMPREFTRVAEEVSGLLNMMLEMDTKRFFSAEPLRDAPLWRLVRRLSSDALSLCDKPPGEARLPLWDLLCYVAD